MIVIILFLNNFLFFKLFTLKSFIMAAVVTIFRTAAASVSVSYLLADQLEGLWSSDPI